MEQAFVGIDVAHAGQQSLVQQGCFNRQSPSMKKRGELLGANCEGLSSWPFKRCALPQTSKLEPPETARVDKTQLASTRQIEPRMRVRSHRCVRRRHKKSARHAEVDDPLRLRRGRRLCSV